MAKGLNSALDEGQTPIIAFNAKGDGGGTSSDVSPTLRAGGYHHSHANSGSWVGVAQQGIGVRRLMPIECERLQGFKDNYTQIPWRGKPADQCPDGPRYKALGNSMAVPVMRWIGERIQAVNGIDSPTEEPS